MIAQFTVEFGINSTSNALNSIQLHLMLFRALLVLLIPNTTVNCAITYTYRSYKIDYLCLMCTKIIGVIDIGSLYWG